MNLYKESDEIRSLFLKFFKNNNHEILKGSSLIPNNDLSILFTNSGMNQFKNILLGLEVPKYKNVATVQKCIRAGGKHNDIDQVGHTSVHNTFFEMLGNFSFGGYFKSESIELALNLITNKNFFNISKKKLLITTHIMDDESYKLWIKMGIKENRIIKVGSKDNFILSDNFWQMGNNGPCGPSTEIFYNFNSNNVTSKKKLLNNNSIEIWNLVFMQFNYYNNKLLKLSNYSIDTGMGLERISSVLQGVTSNYDIDIFNKISDKLIFLFFNKENKNNVSIKIISDHIRSIIFIINEGIYPSNEGRGYILKKIIRRACANGIILGINTPFLYKLTKFVINIMNFYILEFNKNIENIQNIIFLEELKFFKNINNGIKILNKEINKNKFNKNFLSGDLVFLLHDRYGFPIYLIDVFLFKRNIRYDKEKFDYLMNIQKNKSKIKDKFNKYKNYK